MGRSNQWNRYAERLRRLELYGHGRSHPSDEPRRPQATVLIFHLADVETVDASCVCFKLVLLCVTLTFAYPRAVQLFYELVETYKVLFASPTCFSDLYATGVFLETRGWGFHYPPEDRTLQDVRARRDCGFNWTSFVPLQCRHSRRASPRRRDEFDLMIFGRKLFMRRHRHDETNEERIGFREEVM